MTPSTAAEEPGRDHLACGRPLDELLDQVSAGRADDLDSHQSSCPHCRATLAEYDRLWAPVREIADTEVHAPDSVMEQALRRIRGATSNPDHATLPGPTGETRIAARVVVVVARETAQDVAGVRVALSKLVFPGITPRSDDTEPGASGAGAAPEDAAGARAPQVVAGVAGRSTAIEVTLAADYGTDLVALGERIRAEVSSRVRELTGLDPVAVTVHIDDVFE